MTVARQPINIYCASCGAPARFDIARQVYTCEYCGSDTGIREPLQEKLGFRRLHRQNMERQRRSYPLSAGTCTGCGAQIVFPENEALTQCAFCGRALARREYLGVEGFPEVLIPFKLTREEAKQRLLRWCGAHRGKREAKQLTEHADELLGFYLPYELLKGPTDCAVKREDTSTVLHCRGFLEGSFVNTSAGLDNLLLDGMEPYDLADLREFDFAFLAGQRVKMRDLSDEQTADRAQSEVAADYLPYLSRTMETRAIRVTPDTSNLVRLSAVLPVYYLRAGDTLAAVNGQTGKVAVREAKDRYLLPWWLRPIGWTAAIVAVIYGALCLFGVEPMGRMLVAGLMTVFLLLVLFTAYHDKYGGDTRFRLPRRIFTSDDSTQQVPPPELYETVGGKACSARVRFTTPLRVLKMLGITFGTVFLPLILAFLLNGCSARGLTVGGAAVWLCITVPVAPVYLLKFGRLDLYERPLVRILTPEGKWKRLRGRSLKDRLKKLRGILSPGLWIAAGVVLLILIINVYLILHWD